MRYQHRNPRLTSAKFIATQVHKTDHATKVSRASTSTPGTNQGETVSPRLDRRAANRCALATMWTIWRQERIAADPLGLAAQSPALTCLR